MDDTFGMSGINRGTDLLEQPAQARR
jgi:hypothetical protein